MDPSEWSAESTLSAITQVLLDLLYVDHIFVKEQLYVQILGFNNN